MLNIGGGLFHSCDCFDFLQEQLFGRNEVEYSPRVVVAPHFDVTECLACEVVNISSLCHEPPDHPVSISGVPGQKARRRGRSRRAYVPLKRAVMDIAIKMGLYGHPELKMDVNVGRDPRLTLGRRMLRSYRRLVQQQEFFMPAPVRADTEPEIRQEYIVQAALPLRVLRVTYRFIMPKSLAARDIYARLPILMGCTPSATCRRASISVASVKMATPPPMQSTAPGMIQMRMTIQTYLRWKPAPIWKTIPATCSQTRSQFPRLRCL